MMRLLGYKAMLFAMIPDFQSTLPDPGSGKTMRYYRGCLTEHELLGATAVLGGDYEMYEGCGGARLARVLAYDWGVVTPYLLSCCRSITKL